MKHTVKYTHCCNGVLWVYNADKQNPAWWIFYLHVEGSVKVEKKPSYLFTEVDLKYLLICPHSILTNSLPFKNLTKCLGTSAMD